MSGLSALGPRDRRVRLASGALVGFAEYGDPAGLPVIGFHGAPASRLMFAMADAECRQLRLRLIAPDRPGIGLTPAGREPHTLRSVAADMEALVSVLALERFGLIGISGGGLYAVATAAWLGTRVQALALVSPVGTVADLASVVSLAWGHRWFFLTLPRHQRLLRLGAPFAAAAFALSPSGFARIFSRLIGGPDRVTLSQPAVQSAVIAMTQEALRQGVGGALADLTAYSQPWNVDLAAIRAPTSLWQGTADIIVPPAAAFELARQIPLCRVFRINGAGHFWVMQHARDVLEDLAATMRTIH